MLKHEDQQHIWDEEHRNPKVLKQMDSRNASSGVEMYFEFLKKNGFPHGRGIEMGCGKGRNSILLASQGVIMDAFDFSPSAIGEAKHRAEGIADITFTIADATKTWPYSSETFDFGIDCFASTDIESLEGRKAAIREMLRVLRPGGTLLAYLLSIDDEFHRMMIDEHPSDERNSFVHPTGKFEKAYDEQDITELFSDFEIIHRQRISKVAEFDGKSYDCSHFWLVFQKPSH